MREGRIGRLVSVRAAMGEYIPDVMPNYRSMYIFEEGGVYELMHDIDLVLWFAGQNPARVMALDGRFSEVGLRSPDLSEILIEFQDRCAASVHLDFFQRARRRQIELLGTDGTLIVEFGQWDRCTLSVYDAGSRSWEHQELRTDRDDMFRAEDGEFLEAIDSGGPSPLDIREARRAIEIVVAARESAETGVSVSLGGASDSGATHSLP
jgi:predicted dehydrogenase